MARPKRYLPFSDGGLRGSNCSNLNFKLTRPAPYNGSSLPSPLEKGYYCTRPGRGARLGGLQRAKNASLLSAAGRAQCFYFRGRKHFWLRMPVVIFSQTLIIKIDRYYGVRLKRTITVLGLVVGVLIK